MSFPFSQEQEASGDDALKLLDEEHAPDKQLSRHEVGFE